MYERMLDKDSEPPIEQIKSYVGEPGYGLLTKLESYLQDRYELSKELRFPFGKGYGWGFKYSHKSAHLCYVFFESGAITVTIQIGTKEAPKLNEQLEGFLPRTRELWDKRYPCGDGGGWIHYRVFSEEELADILKLISIKKKPAR
ncbi:MAG: DUF3788 domain-containing protein [Clostridiales bacterium]|nr:DUF3788 domain-containing protein [Clostridiales bacterium]